MNIGIIGYGIVGKAVEVGFRDKCKLFINDPKYPESVSKDVIVQECAFIFVGVPTPFNVKEKRVDSSIVEKVISELNYYAKDFGKYPIVIIKSAIVPRIVREWVRIMECLHIVVSPEYLTERSFQHDFVNQKVMILGGAKNICESVHFLYDHLSICNKQVKVGYCTAEEAALVKYMENSFLAMKCIFNNQFKRFYDKFFEPEKQATDPHEGFNNLMDIFYLDERMGLFPFKYRVPGPDGDFGYGGKCLPKDVQAIISEGDDQGTELTLMKKVNEINDQIRTNRDWEKIEGALT